MIQDINIITGIICGNFVEHLHVWTYGRMGGADASPTSLIVHFVVFTLHTVVSVVYRTEHKGIRALNGSSGYETGLVSC
jgi:hypothetical protein